MRYVFFGTPHFVVHVLDALEYAGLAPSLIVTVPDKPAGRGLTLQKPPVKLWAEEKGIPVFQPEKLDAQAISVLQKEYDTFVVAGYGKILPKELLDIPRLGTLNVHPSLLPLFRGPSPIETQILSDAKTVGVSIILLDEETDHGPILAQKSFPVEHPMMRSALEKLLWSEGGKLLAESMPAYGEGTLTPVAQNHKEATFTPKLSKDDGLLNLEENPYSNYLKYCAYEGWPGTYFFTERQGKKIRAKVAQAAFENNEFKILRVVPEGKREMNYADFIRV